jgi:uncharacterized membrane protein YoaK (UPF0700 family)
MTPAPRRRDAILISLALAAGCVDAVSFLGLGQVLTAAMTGNTVLLGIALGQAEGQAALRAGVALLGFFTGVVLGAVIVDRSAGPWSASTAAALALELLMLVSLALTWHLFEHASWIDGRFPLIAAAGIAMGLQSAVAHRLGVAGIATTYVTGTLTTLASRLVGRLGGSGLHRDRVDELSPWLPALVWLAYGLGAASAGATSLWWPSVTPPALVTDVVGDLRWARLALMLPIVIVTAVLLMTALGARQRLPALEPDDP